MYPMCGHISSYPHQRPYAPYYQNLEQTPYQMKPDLPKSPSPYEIHPYGFNNYYHPHPMDFPGCCNHNYFSNSYTFRPPYPHFPPPQPFHFNGNYAPHPHYPVDMPPRYDYDKIAPRDQYCFGCPNHSCTGKENRIVKVEPDPDSEKKTTDSFGNYPYPVVWIPPGFLKKEEEKKKSTEVDSKGEEGNENSKSDEGTRLLNRWLPLDLNKLESLMQGGDKKKAQKRKNEEDHQFPFSIFGIPSNPKELETNGLEDKKMPSKFSITPVKTVDNEDSNSLQNIPKKMEMQNDTRTEGKSRNIPVQFRTHGGDAKITKNSEKGVSSSSSPQKSSKLPPVCLRVDPLPGKKRNSRSPSPTNRGKSEDSLCENFKIQEKSVEDERKKGKCVSEESTGKNVKLAQSDEEKCEVGEKKVEIEKEESKPVNKIWSDDEAAVKIQSVYRGYEVRKWDPLNKLKQIAKVKDQMAEVRRSIEALPASSTKDKQRLVIGESIMSLLLKLDTIQGFHPSIRDIRKSVARQLVSLQEKLDTLFTKNPIDDLSTIAALSTEENVEPLMVQEAANIEEEQAGHGGAPEVVQDTFGKSENSTVLKDVLNLQTEEPIPVVEGNDEKDLEQSKSESDVQLEDVRENEVNQEVVGSSALKDEDTKSDEAVFPLGTEEPKSEISIAGEGTAEEVPKETNGVDESSVSEIEKNAEGDNAVLPSRTEKPEIEIPFVSEKNDVKILDEILAESDVQLEESSGEVGESFVSEGNTTKVDEGAEPSKIEELAVEIPVLSQGNEEIGPRNAEFDVQLEETKGKEDETSVSEGEATKADEVVLFSNTEEPKIELSVIREDVEIVPGETKAEDVQPEEAQEKEFGHRVEGSGKTDKVQMHALQEDQMEKQLNKEISHSEEFIRRANDEKLREENEKLKEMVEKLVEAGKDQLSAISNLSGKVKDLEKKLSKKKKIKTRNRARKLRTCNEQMVLNE